MFSWGSWPLYKFQWVLIPSHSSHGISWWLSLVQKWTHNFRSPWDWSEGLSYTRRRVLFSLVTKKEGSVLAIIGSHFWPQTQREIDLGESCHWGQKSRQIERRRVRNSITDRAQLTQRPGLPCEVLHYWKAVWVGFYLSQNNSIKVLSCIWILVSHLSWQTVNVVLIRRSWFIPANNTLFLGKRCGHLYFSWLKEEIIISILKHYFKGLIRPYS